MLFETLKNHNACPGLLQDGVNTIVAKLLIARESGFQRGLNVGSWIPRKGDLVLGDFKSRTIKNSAIIFAKITIDVIAIVRVIDYLFSEEKIESVSDISKCLAAPL